MLGFLEALGSWGIPISILICLAFAFVFIQLIGELLELCGKAVPTFFKVRKYFTNRKESKKAAQLQYEENNKTLKEVKDQQSRVEALLTEIHTHYSTDNIAKRDKWMLDVNCKLKWVDERAKIYDQSIEDIKECLSQNSANLADAAKQLSDTIIALQINTKMTEDIFIENHRDRIISFADKVADPQYETTEEQFDRIFELYEEYEDFNRDHNRKNGKVNRNMNIITEAYNYRKKNHLFIEDTNKYNGLKND